MTLVNLRDIGDTITVSQASVLDAITAGGAGNNVAVTGSTVDRMDPNTGSLAASVKLSVLWSAILSATYTLTLKNFSLSHSPDGVNWTTGFATFTDPGVVATGPTGGGTVTGVTSVSAEVDGAFRYVRLVYTPQLSNVATDTASLWAAAVLGGFDRRPV